MWIMWLKSCLLIYAVAEAVKIDMKGSINVGQGVAKALSQYFKDDVIDLQKSGRRQMASQFDKLYDVIRRTKFCQGTNFCNDKKEAFIVDYLLALTTVVRSVFDGVLDDELCLVKGLLKSIKGIKQVRKDILETTAENEVYSWNNILRKCSASFIINSVKLIKIASDKEKPAAFALRQSLIFGIVNIEKEYQTKLCKDFIICPYQYDASINLQQLLNLIKSINDTRVNVFIYQFKRNFLHSPVFKELGVNTMKNFEETLNDMMSVASFGKEVILSITDVVQKRLALFDSVEIDALVLQAILADFDHLYVNNKDEPIESFMDVFKQWLRSRDDAVLGEGMKALYNGLASHFHNEAPELVYKLKTEAQVFLELAVGPR